MLIKSEIIRNGWKLVKIITSGAEFKGFLLQARTTEEAVVGTWSVPEGSASKTLDCPNNSTMVNLCNIQLCHRLSLPAIGRYRILKYKYTILFFFQGLHNPYRQQGEIKCWFTLDAPTWFSRLHPFCVSYLHFK